MQLILNLIALIRPLTECRHSLIAHKVLAVYRAAVVVEAQLVVDERVVEVDGGSIALSIGIAYALDARPIEGTKTHRTRLARAIHRAPREVEGGKLATGIAYGHNLGVCRGVVVRNYAVSTTRHHPTITHDDGAKGASATIYILDREVYGHLHKAAIVGRNITPLR